MITVVEYVRPTKKLIVHENVDWTKFQQNPDHLYWWDFNLATEDDTVVLREFFHFHPLAIADCVSDIHYPKIEFYDSYLYLVVHGVDIDRTQVEGFAPKELDIFLGRNYLVTYHKKEMRSAAEVARRCRENTPIFDFGLDFVLYSILDILVTNYMPVLNSIEDDLDAIEELIFKTTKKDILRDLLGLKRTLLRLKKTIFPQREVINHLARNEYDFVQQRTQAYFRDVYDMLYRMAEMTESFRDVGSTLVESHFAMISNRMNEIMKVLTVFATIFGPLTVLTGIYGMNFDHMPELRWQYGYYYVLGAMGVVVISLLSYFRWKDWL